jgi:hypothetical protein
LEKLRLASTKNETGIDLALCKTQVIILAIHGFTVSDIELSLGAPYAKVNSIHPTFLAHRPDLFSKNPSPWVIFFTGTHLFNNRKTARLANPFASFGGYYEY